MKRAGRAKPRNNRDSLIEYGRGVAGGFLFSLPLLFTAEVWETGFLVDSGRMLICLGVIFALLFGYNRYAGMHPEAGWLEIGLESFEEMGLGLILAAFLLWMLGQITVSMPLEEVMGKVVLGAMVVAIGFSVGTAQLGGDESTSEQRRESRRLQGPLGVGGQLVLGTCGSVLVAGNVAPTEEVLIIASKAAYGRLVVLAIVSVLITVAVLFFSNFAGAHRFVRREKPVDILMAVAISYAVALVSSWLMLWFFGRLDGEGVTSSIAQTVVLALPGALGASAGRLLLQQ